MKTAMQELIELMESHHKRGWSYMTFDFFFNELKEHTFLEKEKEQIMEAYENGWHNGFGDEPEILNTEEYYNQTYNQNK